MWLESTSLVHIAHSEKRSWLYFRSSNTHVCSWEVPGQRWPAEICLRASGQACFPDPGQTWPAGSRPRSRSPSSPSSTSTPVCKKPTKRSLVLLKLNLHPLNQSDGPCDFIRTSSGKVFLKCWLIHITVIVFSVLHNLQISFQFCLSCWIP